VTDPNDFQNPESASTKNGASNLKFEREDWSLFRTIEGLSPKGVEHMVSPVF
jgi:hypothetical protein